MHTTEALREDLTEQEKPTLGSHRDDLVVYHGADARNVRKCANLQDLKINNLEHLKISLKGSPHGRFGFAGVLAQ